MKAYFPTHSAEREAITNEIVGIQVEWLEEFAMTNVSAITDGGHNMLSTFADANGVMYLGSESGRVYRARLSYDFSPVTAMLEYFSKIPATNNADGAKNIQTNILMDFGNLPDDGSFGLPIGYKTKLANNGPRSEERRVGKEC